MCEPLCGSDQTKHDLGSTGYLFFHSKYLASQSRKEILCLHSVLLSLAVDLARQVIDKRDFRGKLCLGETGQEGSRSKARRRI